MHFVHTDGTGRIESTTGSIEYAGTDMYAFDFPDDFDFLKQHDYRIVDGELVHDPLPPDESEVLAERERLRAQQIGAAAELFIRESAPTMADAQALSFSELYEEWSDLIGKTVTKGQIIRHDGELYRIGQDHTAQAQWIPGQTGTEALYSHISIEGGYEDWKPWDGVTGLYKSGDIRRDPEDGKLYICIGDNCTYGPPHSTPDFWQPYDG